jgi:hypothetical protein
MVTNDMMWCPNCGAEYRAGYTECSDCGVALTATPPELDEDGRPVTAAAASADHARRTAHEDHTIVAYDLEGLDDQQLVTLQLLLDGAEVSYTQDGTLLLVSHVRQAEVEEMIDSVEGVDLDET